MGTDERDRKFKPQMFALCESQPDKMVFSKPDGSDPVMEIDLKTGKMAFHGEVDEATKAFLEAVTKCLAPKHLRCSRCGKAVSGAMIPVEGDLFVKAYVECPTCVEKYGNSWMELQDGKEVFPLKAVLMELGNRLVMKDGFDPAYSTIRNDVAQTVARVSIDGNNAHPLPGKPSTDLIAAFTAFVNMREEARKHLRDLGVQWEM